MPGFLLILLCAFLCPIIASGAEIYTDAIEAGPGVQYDPAHDTRARFVAPDGRKIEALVKGPGGTGTYSRPMRDGEDADAYFPNLVRETIAAHAHRLIVPYGRYFFHGPKPEGCRAAEQWNCEAHWTIGSYPTAPVIEPDSISDLEIDLSGSILNFYAPVTGIRILEAQRLRLRNFTIDWPSLRIASLGRIVADPANPGHNALLIDAAYPIEDAVAGGTVRIAAVDPWEGAGERGHFAATADNAHEVYFEFGGPPQPVYVGRTAAGDQAFSCRTCRFTDAVGEISCSFFRGCANFDGIERGTRVIVRHYTYNGFAVLVSWSNDIDIENATVLAGPGMGFAVNKNGGYRGFRLFRSAVRRAPGRLISTASDGINVALASDVIISGNEVAYQGDDGINLSPNVDTVTHVDGATLAVAAPCDPDPMDSPIAGDILAFFKPDFGYLGSRIVDGVSGPNCGSRTVLLRESVDGLLASHPFVDLTRYAAARYVIQGNWFHDNRGHGNLLGAAYGLVDGNRYERNSMAAIALAGGSGEGPGVSNLTISNNRFENLPGPAIVVTSAHNLRIGPTTVRDSGTGQRQVIQVSASTGVTICGGIVGGAQAGFSAQNSQVFQVPTCSPPAQQSLP